MTTNILSLILLIFIAIELTAAIHERSIVRLTEAVHAANGLSCLQDLITTAHATIAAVKRSLAEGVLMEATATATVENFSSLVAAVVSRLPPFNHSQPTLFFHSLKYIPFPP